MKIDYSKRLDKFLEQLKKIPEIIGVYYTGSTAKQNWDRFSDLDIDIVVKDKDLSKVKEKIPSLMRWWGKINLMCDHMGIDETSAYVGEDYFKIELALIKLSDVEPNWWLNKETRLAFDRHGDLMKLYEQSKKSKRPIADEEEFNHFFLYTRSNFIYAVRQYMRGAKLSGTSELNRIGGDLFLYLAKLKELEAYELLRKAEKLLSAKEWTFLEKSRCYSLGKKEFKRAIKANWGYMKYLEKEYEKVTKKKLTLKCNDKEILNLINKELK